MDKCSKFTSANSQNKIPLSPKIFNTLTFYVEGFLYKNILFMIIVIYDHLEIWGKEVNTKHKK